MGREKGVNMGAPTNYVAPKRPFSWGWVGSNIIDGVLAIAPFTLYNSCVPTMALHMRLFVILAQFSR